MSATSSRNNVPPCAFSNMPACTSRPSFSIPNSSSSKRSGDRRAALTDTKAESERGLQLWSKRAATSLPTPAGPVISIRLPVPATFFSVARTALIAADDPVSSSECPTRAFSAAFSARRRSVSVAFETKCKSLLASNGFSIKSAAPWPMAATAVSILPCPEKTITGICGSRNLIARSSSMPSIDDPRSHTSRRISDGNRSSSAAKASSAEDAVLVPYPSSSRTPETKSRMSCSSSTISMSSAILAHNLI